MKWWFKLNKNKLYRRYKFDPNNFLLKKGKMTKVLKFLMYFQKLNKTKILFKKKKLFFNKLKNTKKSNKTKKFYYGKKKKTFKKTGVNFWYLNFWNKIKINYFFKKKKLKFKNLRRNFRFVKSKQIRKNLNKRIKNRIFYERYKVKKLKISDSTKKNFKIKKRNFYKKFVWLFVKASKKRKKTWFLVRIALRKSAIYHGFTKLKKFRYIYKSNIKAMPVYYNYNLKLENMLNIFILRLNFFDNIFVVNNFIKRSEWIYIDYKKKRYPFKFLKIGQILSFWPLKNLQSIFKKRSMFNKSYYLKKLKEKIRRNISSKIFKVKLVKIIKNVPKHIFYDYQIMHFCLIKGVNKFDSTNKKKIYDDWCLETRLQYN